MAPIGVVAVVVVVLFWAAPELRSVPTGLLRKVFFVFLCADICVPFYYTIQVPGLPWISLRRLLAFCLIALFAVSVSGSPKVRGELKRTISIERSFYICFVGYYIICGLSILTSVNPPLSSRILLTGR